MNSAPNFDRVARIYRWAEYLTLGPLLQRIRSHFLPQLADRRRALVLGDGDGRFLARLLAQNPALQATAVDTSDQMLTLLRARCGPTRVQTIHADALTTSAPAPDTDLIVTHFFPRLLHANRVNLRQHWPSQTQPGTLWLLSDFRIPGHPSDPRARYIRSLYFAFRVLTGLRATRLPDPAAALYAAGFRRIAQHQSLSGLLYTELWQCSEVSL